jgi:hypothetical protein
VEGASVGHAVGRPQFSPRRPLMAGRGRSTGAGGGSAREAKGRRSLYRGRARLLATGGPTAAPRGCAPPDERRTDRRFMAWCATGECGRSKWRAGTSRAASGRAAPWEGARPVGARPGRRRWARPGARGHFGRRDCAAPVDSSMTVST